MDTLLSLLEIILIEVENEEQDQNQISHLVPNIIKNDNNTISKDNPHCVIYGYMCCFFTVVFLGSGLVPAKKVGWGDGYFFSFIQAIGMFVTALSLTLSRGSYELIPGAILGGCLWTTGAIFCLPALNLLGLGLAMTCWSSAKMLTGWLVGTYGLFGTARDNIKYPILNLIGFLLSMSAICLYCRVKPNLREQEMRGNINVNKIYRPTLLMDENHEGDTDGSISINNDNDNNTNLREHLLVNHNYKEEEEEEEEKEEELEDGVLRNRNESITIDHNNNTDHLNNYLSDLKGNQRLFVGFFFAFIAGVFFGLSFIPVKWIIDNEKHDSPLNYIFSQYCGNLLAAIFYFLSYIYYKLYISRESPQMNTAIIFPAILAGILVCLSYISWFISNTLLGFSIVFPINCSLPSLVGGLWSIFYFKEIEGQKNFILYFGCFTIVTVASIIIAVSH